MSKHLKLLRSENIEEVFLAEALGHVSAYDTFYPKKDKIILKKGSMITPRTVSALAAYGIDRIFIFRKPQVSIIVIGGNLISPGFPQAPGKSYDFSIAALKAALEMMKIRPVLVRILGESPKKIGKMISFAVNQSDIVVLVVKEFERDVRTVQKFLDDMRAQFIFPGTETNLNPKKMQLDKNKKPVFCLPYDSELIFESFDKFVQPAIWKFMGVTNLKDPACGMS